jgi:hypothetical protein
MVSVKSFVLFCSPFVALVGAAPQLFPSSDHSIEARQNTGGLYVDFSFDVFPGIVQASFSVRHSTPKTVFLVHAVKSIKTVI